MVESDKIALVKHKVHENHESMISIGHDPLVNSAHIYK